MGHGLEPGAEGDGLRDWFHTLPKAAPHRRAAAFDTRGEGPMVGAAAKGIAHRLERHGYDLVAEPRASSWRGTQPSSARVGAGAGAGVGSRPGPFVDGSALTRRPRVPARDMQGPTWRAPGPTRCSRLSLAIHEPDCEDEGAAEASVLVNGAGAHPGRPPPQYRPPGPCRIAPGVAGTFGRSGRGPRTRAWPGDVGEARAVRSIEELPHVAAVLPASRARAAAGGDVPPTTRGQVLAMAVDYAVRAPSVHDTPAVADRSHPDRLVIRAERSRRAAVVDPKGARTTGERGSGPVQRAGRTGTWWLERGHRAAGPPERPGRAGRGAAGGQVPRTVPWRAWRRPSTAAAPTGGASPAPGCRTTSFAGSPRVAETDGVMLHPHRRRRPAAADRPMTQRADGLQNADPAYRAELPPLDHPSARADVPGATAGGTAPSDADQSDGAARHAHRRRARLAARRGGDAARVAGAHPSRLGWPFRLTQPMEVPLARTSCELPHLERPSTAAVTGRGPRRRLPTARTPRQRRRPRWRGVRPALARRPVSDGSGRGSRRDLPVPTAIPTCDHRDRAGARPGVRRRLLKPWPARMRRPDRRPAPLRGAPPSPGRARASRSAGPPTRAAGRGTCPAHGCRPPTGPPTARARRAPRPRDPRRPSCGRSATESSAAAARGARTSSTSR